MTSLPVVRKPWWGRNWLTLLLWGLFLGSSFLMVKSSSDPLIAPLRQTVWEKVFSQFPTGNQIIFDTSVGINVGLFIYVLVVWLPERGKRDRIRRSLRQQYESFKEECIWIYLSALKGEHGEPPDDLKDPIRFREWFHEPSSTPGQERWHAVLNGLKEFHIKRLAIEFEILMTEVQFTLAAIDVDNHEAFAFLKRLLHDLHRMTYVNESYDEVKQLSRLLWSIHTGWSFTEGYREKDPIAQMIESI